MQDKQTQRIDSYSFFEFCQKVQEEIIKGWRFDFDSNENCPVQMGTFLTCGMILDDQVVQEEKVEEPKKVTRKAKVQETCLARLDKQE